MDRNKPMIIAMQGDAYTGKTTLANELAIRLKFPTIRLDDILDLANPTDQPHQLETLISNAFDLIAQIVRTQISLGLSIIIDSPLSRLCHLLKLVALFSTDPTERSSNTRLLIIECKPNNEYAWQMRFEELDFTDYANKWYKPVAQWPLPKLSRDYTDDDMPPMVSKLVVNTTDFYMPCHMVMAVYDVTYCGDRHIVNYSSQWHFIHKENHEEFRCPSCPIDPINTTTTTKNKHAHIIVVYKEEGIDYDDTLCGVCENQVTKSSGACYTCKDCPLTLHKSCAELSHGNKRYFDPKNFPKFLLMEPNVVYAFTEERTCDSCREQGKAFSCECRPCVVESHLKSRMVPTVVRHEAHEHLLAFAAKSVTECDRYICVACRKYGAFVAYVCSECILVTYHPECVLLPPSVDHNHGGHTHGLEMVFGWEEEMEDYMCDLCQEKMDPQAWYYHCRKCIVSLHLECAFLDFNQ